MSSVLLISLSMSLLRLTLGSETLASVMFVVNSTVTVYLCCSLGASPF